MHLGFALELSDNDLWNIDLLNTHLDLLDTSPVSILFLSMVSSKRLQDKSLKHLEDMSSRRLGRRKIVTLKMRWRRLQDMS